MFLDLGGMNVFMQCIDYDSQEMVKNMLALLVSINKIVGIVVN